MAGKPRADADATTAARRCRRDWDVEADPDAPNTVGDAYAAEFLNDSVGPGGWVFDAVADCWIVPDQNYEGPGRGFWVYCRDFRMHHAVVVLQ